MGMFDTVRIRCPHCRGVVDEQTKFGECILKNEYLDDCDEEMKIGVSGYPITCYHCNEKLIVKSQTITQVYKYKYEDEEL
jgi:DNA-directed RNA polymerase subunit RPC12/RpoP